MENSLGVSRIGVESTETEHSNYYYFISKSGKDENYCTNSTFHKNFTTMKLIYYYFLLLARPCKRYKNTSEMNFTRRHRSDF